MNESIENTEVMEETADQQDAFLDGWGEDDGIDTEGSADGQDADDQEESVGSEADAGSEDAGEGSPEGTENGASGEAQEADAAENTDQQPPEGQQAEPKTWTLRHLDSERTVGEAEMVTLARRALTTTASAGSTTRPSP